jgi:hypothetical protein
MALCSEAHASRGQVKPPPGMLFANALRDYITLQRQTPVSRNLLVARGIQSAFSECQSRSTYYECARLGHPSCRRESTNFQHQDHAACPRVCQMDLRMQVRTTSVKDESPSRFEADTAQADRSSQPCRQSIASFSRDQMTVRSTSPCGHWFESNPCPRAG